MSPNEALESKMVIGGYDDEGLSYDKKKHSLFSHPITGSFHWEIKLVKFGYGDVLMDSTLSHILTDTGTSLLYLPPDLFNKLNQEMARNVPPGMEAKFNNGKVYFEKCDTLEYFKPLKFQLGQYIYEVPVKYYFVKYPMYR